MIFESRDAILRVVVGFVFENALIVTVFTQVKSRFDSSLAVLEMGGGLAGRLAMLAALGWLRWLAGCASCAGCTEHFYTR